MNHQKIKKIKVFNRIKMKTQKKINGKAKTMVKIGNAKMKIDKTVTLQITQVQTGSPSNTKTKNSIIKVITIREIEKGSLEYRAMKSSRETIME